MAEVAFLTNPMVQDAVILNFEIIGEASNSIEKHALIELLESWQL